MSNKKNPKDWITSPLSELGVNLSDALDPFRSAVRINPLGVFQGTTEEPLTFAKAVGLDATKSFFTTQHLSELGVNLSDALDPFRSAARINPLDVFQGATEEPVTFAKAVGLDVSKSFQLGIQPLTELNARLSYTLEPLRIAAEGLSTRMSKLGIFGLSTEEPLTFAKAAGLDATKSSFTTQPLSELGVNLSDALAPFGLINPLSDSALPLKAPTTPCRKCAAQEAAVRDRRKRTKENVVIQEINVMAVLPQEPIEVISEPTDFDLILRHIRELRENGAQWEPLEFWIWKLVAEVRKDLGIDSAPEN